MGRGADVLAGKGEGRGGGTDVSGSEERAVFTPRQTSRDCALDGGRGSWLPQAALQTPENISVKYRIRYFFRLT